MQTLNSHLSCISTIFLLTAAFPLVLDGAHIVIGDALKWAPFVDYPTYCAVRGDTLEFNFQYESDVWQLRGDADAECKFAEGSGSTRLAVWKPPALEVVSDKDSDSDTAPAPAADDDPADFDWWNYWNTAADTDDTDFEFWDSDSDSDDSDYANNETDTAFFFQFNHTVRMPGRFWFASSQGRSCLDGQKVLVRVQNSRCLEANPHAESQLSPPPLPPVSPPISPPAPISPPPSPPSPPPPPPSPPPALREGWCDPPVEVQGTRKVIRCVSPAFTLYQGQMKYFAQELLNPFPKGSNIGILARSAYVVNHLFQPVGQNEVYVHLFLSSLHKGNGFDLVNEVRPFPPFDCQTSDTDTDSLELFDCYRFAEFRLPEDLEESTRTTYLIHGTKSLGSRNLRSWSSKYLPCIECKCPGNSTTSSGLQGGLQCCKSCEYYAPQRRKRLYYLMYTVDFIEMDTEPCWPLPCYRWTRRDPLDDNILSAFQQRYDIAVGANQSIEYDVPARDPDGPIMQVHEVELLTTIDAFDPQEAVFQLLRCSGHQKIGGLGIYVYWADTNKLLCQMLPVYGTDREQDFLQSLTDFDFRMTPRSQVMIVNPNTTVRIVSRYEMGHRPHTGVMAFATIHFTNQMYYKGLSLNPPPPPTPVWDTCNYVWLGQLMNTVNKPSLCGYGRCPTRCAEYIVNAMTCIRNGEDPRRETGKLDVTIFIRQLRNVKEYLGGKDRCGYLWKAEEEGTMSDSLFSPPPPTPVEPPPPPPFDPNSTDRTNTDRGPFGRFAQASAAPAVHPLAACFALALALAALAAAV